MVAVRAYGAVNATAGAGSTAVSCVLPAGILGGDRITVAVATAGPDTTPAVAPTGFGTLLSYLGSGGTSNNNGLILYSKVAAGTVGSASSDAGATVSLTLAAAAQWAAGSWVMVGDPATDTPTTVGADANSTTMTVPGFTPTHTGLAVAAAAIRYNSNTGGDTVTPGSGWTEQVDAHSSSGAPRGLWLADRTLATTTAVGSSNATLTDAGRSAIAVLAYQDAPAGMAVSLWDGASKHPLAVSVWDGTTKHPVTVNPA